MTDGATGVGDFDATRADMRVDSQHGSGDKFVFIGEVQRVQVGTIVPTAGNPRTCLDYRVIGICFWLQCTHFGCDVETSVRVSHYKTECGRLELQQDRECGYGRH